MYCIHIIFSENDIELRIVYFYYNVQELHKHQLSQLTVSLDLARQEIETLRYQEQEAALAAAETKQKIHEEMLSQEEEMATLRSEREYSNAKSIYYLLSLFK